MDLVILLQFDELYWLVIVLLAVDIKILGYDFKIVYYVIHYKNNNFVPNLSMFRTMICDNEWHR